MHILCPHCRNPIELVKLSPRDEIVCPSCGSTFHVETGSTTSWERKAGQRFGKFEVLETVGQGAFGTVYKARDTELDRVVAVKVPRAGNLAGPQELDRFLREARSVAQLRHPSIVSVHDVGQADGLPYLVSDFVQGMTLTDLLSARRPGYRAAAELVATVADALHYAHEQGVVHRDVKPSNIMIQIKDEGARMKDEKKTGDGEGHSSAVHPSSFILHPFLMDFGLAKREAGEITMTMEGQVLGTPAYMPPEQARGEGHEVDARGDVYSLGVVLYQLLTGELPFRGTARMLLHQVLTDEPRAPRSLNDHIPRDLETIALKAMAKEPGRRYATARDFADDLRRWLKGEPIRARRVSRVERVAKLVKRNRVTAALSAATVVVALVGAAAFVWQFGEAVQARNRAEGNEQNAKEEARNARDAESRERAAKVQKEEALAHVTAERNRADASAEKTRELLYVTRCNLAVAALRAGNYGQADRLLAAMKSTTDGRDLRGFEWHVLDRLMHGNRTAVRLEGADAVRDGQAVTDFFYTEDRRWAVRLDHEVLRVWDTATGKVARTIRLDPDTVYYCWRCSQGSARWQQCRFRSEAEKGPVRKVVLLDPETGQARPWKDPDAKFAYRAAQVVVDPAGERAAGIFLPGPRGLVWDQGTGKILAEIQLPSATERDPPLVEWAEDGKNLRLSSGGIYDPATGFPRFPEVVPLGHVSFSKDGRRFAFYRPEDRQILVYDTATGEKVTSVALADALQRLAASGPFFLGEDGESLLLGNRLFDLTGLHPPAMLHGLTGTDLEIHGQGTSVPALKSPFGTGGFRFFDPEPGPRVLRGGIVVAADRRGTVTTYQPAGSHRFPRKIDDSNISLIGACVCGRTFVTRAGKFPLTPFRGLLTDDCDSSLVVWDLRSGGRRQVPEYEGWGDPFTPELSRNGRRAFSKQQAHPFAREVWTLMPGAKVTRAQGLASLAMAVAGGPDPLATGLTIICALGQGRLTPLVGPKDEGRSNLLRVYDTDEGKYILSVRKEEFVGGLGHPALSEDGEWLAINTWPVNVGDGTRPTGSYVIHVATRREVQLDGGGGTALVPDYCVQSGRALVRARHE